MSASNQLPQAIQFHQSGELGKANEIYLAILSEAPEHLQALCLSGSIAQHQGDFHRAITLFTKANQLNPALASVYIPLGICHTQIGDLDTANSFYKKATLLAPQQIEPLVNLANNLLKQNQFSESFALYKKALAITPDSALIHYNIGSLFLKSMKPAQAQSWFRKALALQANNASAWNSLGVCLTELGELPEALEAYQQAITLDPHFVEPLFNRHAVLVDLERGAEAMQALEQAASLDSANPMYVFFLGMLQAYCGQEELGEKTLRLIAQAPSVQPELESWAHLKTLNLQSSVLTGTNTKTIEVAMAHAKLDGLVLEFGVYNGKSICNIASLVQTEVHGFDSFEGIPENWNDEPQGSYSANGDLPEVPANVTLHQGWFDQTIPEFKKTHPEPIRFMNIDCDLYSSTKTIFDLLGPQIVPGTVIVFDEYIGYKSWKEDEFKAFQEALVQYQWKYELLAFSFASKQVAIKII
jgi:tetratricopeptide (TPR) repeat protein